LPDQEDTHSNAGITDNSSQLPAAESGCILASEDNNQSTESPGRESTGLPGSSNTTSSTSPHIHNQDCSGAACRATGSGGVQASHSLEAPCMKHSAWQWSREHILLPALGLYFSPPNIMATNGSVLQIADLHELYKVFERC